MEDNNYYREIIINYSLIIILCLFLVVYIVINYSVIQEGNLYGGNIPKTIIITGIIFLILYIFLTLEEEQDVTDTDTLIIPKYRIINKLNINENESKKVSKPQESFKIENKYNSKYNKENSINKLEISDNKVENSKIFVEL